MTVVDEERQVAPFATPEELAFVDIGEELGHLRRHGVGLLPLAPSTVSTVSPDGEHAFVRTRLREGNWLVSFRLRADRSGHQRVVEVVVLAGDEAGTSGLTRAALTDHTLLGLLDIAVDDAEHHRHAYSDNAEAVVTALLEQWRGDARRTGARRDRLAYAALAARYAGLVRDGDRKPAATLGRYLGRSPVTISQRIREAREMGLLSRVPAGIAGGRITTEALQLLTDAASSENAGGPAHRSTTDNTEE